MCIINADTNAPTHDKATYAHRTNENQLGMLAPDVFVCVCFRVQVQECLVDMNKLKLEVYKLVRSCYDLQVFKASTG